ncbi:MAG: hypothetical protein ACRERC_21515, partial [Candidatus Binatia bacterium]
AAVLAYAVAAIAFTWPLAARLTHELAGNAVDIWIVPWDTWWVGRSLRAGASPFFTRELYFPAGTSLVFHTLLLPGTTWAALTGSLLSPLTYDNLLILGGLFSSALAAYALAVALTGSPPAAFLAGLLYGFTPNRLDQARAHPDCVLGLWLPLMLLGAVWMLRAETRRRRATGAALAAVAAGLGLLSRPAYTFAGFYLIAALTLLQPLAGVRLRRLPALAWCAAIGAGALLVIAPYTLAVARAWPPPPPGAGYEVEYANAAISLERFVVPPIASTLWGGLANRFDPQASVTARAGKVAFLGYGLLLLLAGGALVARREPAWWFWLTGGVACAALSLGPSVQLWGRATGVALPYADLPLLALVRAPNRLVPAAVLCFALAVAVAWTRWVRRHPRSAWLTALVGLGLALDMAMVPFPTTRPAPSPFYAQLGDSTERFGLVEVPSVHNLHDTLYLYYQTIHGKPLHAGHVSRPDPAATARLGAVPLLAAIRDAGQGLPPAALHDAAGALRNLEAQGFRYLLFHTRFDEHPRFRGLNAGEQAILAQVAPLLGPPAYEDESLIAYDLRRAPASTP